MTFKMKGFPMHKTASALKQKSPMKAEERQLTADDIKEESITDDENVDFSTMTPVWVGDEEAMKELERKRERLSFLFDSEQPVELGGQGRPLTDEERAEYLALKAEVEEMDRQFSQSQVPLGEEGSIPADTWARRRKELADE